MGMVRADLLPFFPAAPDLRPIPGDANWYQLKHAYDFVDQFEKVWRIPPGYVYDGASVPSVVGLTWAATYAKTDSRVMRAALVHDFFCDNKPAEMSSADACDLFHKMLLEDGASAAKAGMMAKAVRWFGPQWG